MVVIRVLAVKLSAPTVFLLLDSAASVDRFLLHIQPTLLPFACLKHPLPHPSCAIALAFKLSVLSTGRS